MWVRESAAGSPRRPYAPARRARLVFCRAKGVDMYGSRRGATSFPYRSTYAVTEITPSALASKAAMLSARATTIIGRPSATRKLRDAMMNSITMTPAPSSLNYEHGNTKITLRRTKSFRPVRRCGSRGAAARDPATLARSGFRNAGRPAYDPSTADAWASRHSGRAAGRRLGRIWLWYAVARSQRLG